MIVKIRSDRLRQIVSAAVDQGFTVEHGTRHPALICPVCGHHEIITTSGRQLHHEIRNKISRLRRHGLVFEGRGGEHV